MKYTIESKESLLVAEGFVKLTASFDAVEIDITEYKYSEGCVYAISTGGVDYMVDVSTNRKTKFTSYNVRRRNESNKFISQTSEVSEIYL